MGVGLFFKTLFTTNEVVTTTTRVEINANNRGDYNRLLQHFGYSTNRSMGPIRTTVSVERAFFPTEIARYYQDELKRYGINVSVSAI